MTKMILGSVNLTTIKNVHLSMDDKGDLRITITAATISPTGDIIDHEFEINLMGSALKSFFKSERVSITADNKVLDSLNSSEIEKQ